MIVLNGEKLYEMPTSCGVCPFFFSGNSDFSHARKGHCRMWNEMHGVTIAPPRRCKRLFGMALKFQEGAEVVIVAKE